jgi:hypothetical protein
MEATRTQLDQGSHCLVPTAAQRIVCSWFSGACEMMVQMPQCTGSLCWEIKVLFKSVFLFKSVSICNLLIDLPTYFHMNFRFQIANQSDVVCLKPLWRYVIHWESNPVEESLHSHCMFKRESSNFPNITLCVLLPHDHAISRTFLTKCMQFNPWSLLLGA